MTRGAFAVATGCSNVVAVRRAAHSLLRQRNGTVPPRRIRPGQSATSSQKARSTAITSVKPPAEEKKKGSSRAASAGRHRFRCSESACEDEHEMPVVPDARYVPLYEGRMVQQFDHAAKAYVSGEGRGAKWEDLGFYREAACTPLIRRRGGLPRSANAPAFAT